MIRLRRWAASLGILIFALTMVSVFTEQGVGKVRPPILQPEMEQPSNGKAVGNFSSITIHEDSSLGRIVSVGRDCIKDKVWGQAIEALQKVLNEPKDHYAKLREQDPNNPRVEMVRATSIKFEANNLIGSMPMEGLEVYEQAVGAEAKVKLDDAKKRGDKDVLAEVAQRYCHTKAGIEANEILATLYLARGQVFTAALRYENLLKMNPQWAKVSDVTLFKAAIAFRRADDKKNAEEAWKRLTDSLAGKPGLKIGDDMVTLDKLESVLKETAVVNVVNVHDWPSWRGNYYNSAQANGSPPLLEPLWRRPMFFDKLDGLQDEDQDQEIKKHIDKAIDQVKGLNQPVLPGFFPVVSQGVMVYRNHRGLVAIALKDLEFRDEESGNVNKYKPGQILWKTIPMDRSLGVLLDKQKTKGKIEQWLSGQPSGYDQVPGFSSILYENTVIGTLVTDHRNVYAINDLAVPPHPGAFMTNQFNPQFNQYGFNDIKGLVTQNELLAYDLTTGKLRWDLNAEDSDFKDSHFLGLPITIGGKIYVLNEKLPELGNGGGGPNPWGGQFMNPIPGESELRLVCVDPNKLEHVNNNAKPAVKSIQVLGVIAQHDRFVQDISRRVNTVQLAYGEGVLVCPTNAGEVFGFDLAGNAPTLVWSYPYRENQHKQIVLPGMLQMNGRFGQPNFVDGTSVVSKWKSAPPAIQDGKIVFTAPDADSVHCVNLRDGRPLWKKAQAKGDRFMAGVYEGRVLIVSDTSIRALSLKDGGQLWSIHTGDLPSGQGVASKGIYYLPLSKGEILAVDIVKGEIKAHNRAANGDSAPGNLIFYENMVLSQTPTEVAAYPQLSAVLVKAGLDSTNDPDNMVKLTDYGELLLKDGQVQKAVDALLRVYERKPADPLGARTKQRLFEALTDLMQVDFNKAAADHLTLYEALCKVPGNDAEEQNRKARFFRLVGQGREAQGKLVEAFQMYKDFGALPMNSNGIVSAEDPNQKIPLHVWLRGRISGMLAKATEEQKKPLDAKIAEEWKLVEGKKDLGAIRSFVGMFDVPVRVGREARIRLAETIMDRNDRAAFLEAELSLYQVMGSDYRKDPLAGGRALAVLAQLEASKGSADSLRLAASHYRQLGRDFAKDAVRGAKTGTDLVNEMATDKRFLPYLEEASNPFGTGKFAAHELAKSPFKIELPGFVMRPQGDDTPFARMNRLTLDPGNYNNPILKLREVGANLDRWTINLGQAPMNQQVFSNLYQQQNQPYYPNARFRFYQVKGHLLVCQVGVMVYCIDGDTGKKLWEMQTVENIQANGLVHLQSVSPDREGNPEFTFWHQLTQERFKVSLGRIGAAQASYVAVLGHKGLTVVDPLRGATMWKKADVSVNSHLFGDDQYLFLTEANANGGFGAGRTMRANDGEVLSVPDFSSVYQARIRTVGRQILAAQPGSGNLTVHLYDILTAKDVWTKQFPVGSYVLNAEDRNITGIVDPLGNLTVLDADTGKVLLTSNVIQGRITLADLKGLQSPMLLQDGERFYVALNKPIDTSRVGSGLHNNFNNGTRCLTVNGWFLAVHRQDGKRTANGRQIAWKQGDFAWHSYMPMQNQMIVVDQFAQSPALVFTARYNEIMQNGGNRWISVTQSLSKQNGKMLYDGVKGINGTSPLFATFQMDLKTRTINLIGYQHSVQLYVDDGKGPPMPQGARLNGGGTQMTDGKKTFWEDKVPPPKPRVMRQPIVQPIFVPDAPRIIELPDLKK